MDIPEVVVDPKAPTVSCEVSFSVPRPVGLVYRKFIASPLEDMLPGTAQLPGVDHTEALNNLPFGQAGSRRKVVLNDGHTAVEEVMESQVDRYFKYKVWHYSHPAARPIEYGLGQFWFSGEGDTTLIRWQYSFRLRTTAAVGRLGPLGRWLFRKAFLDHTYTQYMLSGAAAMTAWLATA